MDHLSGVPGFRRWKRDKKQLLRILLIMSLSFFLMEFTFLLGDSLEVSLEERRMDAYGEWQYVFLNINPEGSDPEGEAAVWSIPYLEHVGNLWSAAVLTNEGLDAEYGVGGIEEDAIGISRLQLLSGEFPRAEGEFALEASLVKRLGLKGEPGEKVTLTLHPADKRGEKIPEAEEQTVEGTLCGVFRDYTANWSISTAALLPSVLTTEDILQTYGWTPVRNLLMKGVDDWDMETMEGDLGQIPISTPKSTRLARNEFAYPMQEAGSISATMNLVRIAGGALTVIILGITVLTSVRSRREEYRQLALLGAERRQLREILLKEAVLFGFCSLVLGLGGALLSFLLVIPLFSGFLDFPLAYGFSPEHLLLAAGLGIGVVSLSYAIPCLQVKQLSSLSPRKRKERRRMRKREGRSRGRLTLGTLWLRQWKSHPGQATLKLIVMAGILLVPCLGMAVMDTQIHLLNGQIINFGNSYTLELNTGHEIDADPSLGILKEKLEGIELIYGVDSYEAYQTAETEDLFYMDLSRWSDSEYYQLHKEKVLFWLRREEEELQEMQAMPEMKGSEYLSRRQEKIQEVKDSTEQGIPPTRIVAVNSEHTLQRYLRNLDEGSVDLEAFFRGEEVILLTPDIVVMEYEEGRTVIPEMREEGILADQKRGAQVFPEEEISVGERLTISRENTTVSVPVAAILRTMDSDEPVATGNVDVLWAYTVVCSEAFLDSFPWGSGDCYQAVKVNASGEAGYGTDVLVTRKLSYGGHDMAYENHHKTIEEMRQDLYLQMTLYGTLCGLSVFLLTIILSGISRVSRQYQQERLHIYEDLGMKRSWRVILQLSENALLAVLAPALVSLGLSIWNTWSINQRMAAFGGVERYPLSLNVGFDLSLYFVFCAAAFLLSMAAAGGFSAAPRYSRMPTHKASATVS